MVSSGAWVIRFVLVKGFFISRLIYLSCIFFSCCELLFLFNFGIQLLNFLFLKFIVFFFIFMLFSLLVRFVGTSFSDEVSCAIATDIRIVIIATWSVTAVISWIIATVVSWIVSCGAWIVTFCQGKCSIFIIGMMIGFVLVKSFSSSRSFLILSFSWFYWVFCFRDGFCFSIAYVQDKHNPH